MDNEHLFSNASTVARCVTVKLVRQSVVVPGGIRHQRWQVFYDKRWQEPERIPGAVVLEFGHADAGSGDAERRLPPGCQYRLECELQLPLGTLLQRIISEPREREVLPNVRLDPLSYLRRGQSVRPGRSSVSVPMRVVGNYRIERVRQRARPEAAGATGPVVSADEIEAFTRQL